MEFQRIKTCVVCGCLAVVIITASGPICKKCLKELYKNPDRPVSVLENQEFRSLDVGFSISRSAIGASAVAYSSTDTIYIKKV